MSTATQHDGDTALDHALRYADNGLRVLPIKPGRKYPPMNSWQHAATVDVKTIGNWYRGLYRGHGVGLAMGTQPDGRNLFALDVDEHDPAQSGSDTLAELEQIHGKLPETVRSITGSGGAHLIFDSGDVVVTNGAAGAVGPGLDVRGAGGQIVVAPTVHPNGTAYSWEDGCAPGEIDIAPAPAWLMALVALPEIAEEVTRTPPPLMNRREAGPSSATPADILRETWNWQAELQVRGWQQDPRHPDHWTRPGKDIREGTSAVLHGNGDGPLNVFTTDASALPMWKAGKIGNGCVSLSPLAFVAAYDHGGDLSMAAKALRQQQGIPLAPTQTTPEAPETADEETPRDIAKDGATFILDENADLQARWGSGSEVLWARGESLIIAAPPGVGKTTLAGQLIAGLMGIQSTVLGYPVAEAGRVLYLAMDRPSQIRRALRRRFSEEHRAVLAERLVVRPGPMPGDLGKHPTMLIDLARLHGCDSIVIDSLKDAAVKLTDDETGGIVNRAIQYCNAQEIDVLVLHHQRKGTGGEKPTKLEDVYGSTWITAGAGSVFLLWGEAGSELVEMTHLKQPADPVGPFRIEHDHHLGVSTVSHGFDALAFLRLAGPRGATVAEAAQAEHGGVQASGNAKWKKTERRLRTLVRNGLATADDDQDRGGEGRFGAKRYRAVDTGFTVDTTVDTPSYPQGPTAPSTNHGHTVDALEETPGHTVDTTVDTASAAPPWTNAGVSNTPACPGVDPQEPISEPDEELW